MNELIEKIKKDIMGQIKPSKLSIIDESHKHTHHSGYVEGKLHLKILIQANQLQSMKILDKHRVIHKVIEPYRPHLHATSIQFLD